MWGGRAGRVGGGGDRQLSVLVSLSACAQLSPSYHGLYILYFCQSFVINEFYYEFHALFLFPLCVCIFNGVLLFGGWILLSCA